MITNINIIFNDLVTMIYLNIYYYFYERFICENEFKNGRRIQLLYRYKILPDL